MKYLMLYALSLHMHSLWLSQVRESGYIYYVKANGKLNPDLMDKINLGTP